MNRKRKILTVVALIAFGAVIFFHYCGWHWQLGFGEWPVFRDIRMPLFVLGVVYAGLFFLFGGKDAEPVPRRPRNRRRIIGAILAGLVIVGLIAAIIYSHEVEKRKEAARQANIEVERRKEATRQANIEEEASKHRITESEIDLIDLRLDPPQFPSNFAGFYLTGRIRNRAAHNRTLNSITLIVLLREKEGSQDILGQQTVQIRVEVPPQQTRAIHQTIYFDNPPQVRQYAWTYVITEIRGSAGGTGLRQRLHRNLSLNHHV
jgi:hypothetical protein